MIVVTIELHSAIDGRREKLGEMLIANDGTSGDTQRGNYDVRVMRKGVWSNGLPGWDRVARSVARFGKVTGYPRLSYNVWRLIARAVLSAFPEERPGATADYRKDIETLTARLQRALEEKREAQRQFSNLVAALLTGPVPPQVAHFLGMRSGT